MHPEAHPEAQPEAQPELEPLVRPAAPEDAAELARLAGELGYPATPAEIAARLATLADETNLLLVAVLRSAAATPAAGSPLAGWIHVQTTLGLTGPPCAVIAGLIVDARQRGAGLGRVLVRHAEEWTRARGLSSLRVRSRDVRERAHAFYRGLGFKDVKKQLLLTLELGPPASTPGGTAPAR